ncbi:hypothetical protein [Halioxenophilus aromaticivorans]|uniref:hypothetical protein n=1 Tax=Halioxenophilus aromaticivorans TaxID=1306992 RepID=UPI0031EAF2BA
MITVITYTNQHTSQRFTRWGSDLERLGLPATPIKALGLDGNRLDIPEIPEIIPEIIRAIDSETFNAVKNSSATFLVRQDRTAALRVHAVFQRPLRPRLTTKDTS